MRSCHLFLLSLLLAGPAAAELCTLDEKPAATLLLPYFEVNFLEPTGVNTVVTLNNASSQSTLVHATLWSDWQQPVIDFDIYLTGYDVVVWDLRESFAFGNIPITADDQSDPTDFISPQGPLSTDSSFPECQNFFPQFDNPVIVGNNLERLRDGASGNPVSSIGNRCLSQNHGDNLARGYLTFDSVSQCSTAFPMDPGYFVDGGIGIANNENRIWGDYFIQVGATRTFAHPLVPIEAGAGFDESASATGYTFYGTVDVLGVNNREPLGATWLVPFDLSAGTTDFQVWRDTTVDFFPSNGFVCGTGPSWQPLSEESILCWDDQENPTVLCLDEPCFPLATQSVDAEDPVMALPYERGFCLFDLGIPSDNGTGDVDFGGRRSQSYVVARHRDTAGLYYSGLPAVLVESACDLPPTVLFRDGFESGSTSAWSQTQGN